MWYMPQAKQPAKIQTGGRVSIDADTRRELGLEQGDYVMIDVRPLEETQS